MYLVTSITEDYKELIYNNNIKTHINQLRLSAHIDPAGFSRQNISTRILFWTSIRTLI